MPADPGRGAAGHGEVVDAARLEVAAHPARLDVHDRAGAELQGQLGHRHRRDRLVEAQGGAHEPGQLRVTEEVVLGQRLLDEEEVEGVERLQPGRVLQAVRGVGVDLEQQVATEALPHRSHGLDVPARLDLQLHPPVALVDVAADDVEEGRDRPGDADGDAGGHLRSGRAEHGRQRSPIAPSTGVEHRHLHRRLRHPVPAHRGQAISDACRREVLLGEQREKMLGQHVAGAVDVLGGVERLGHGRALAPAVLVVGDQAHEELALDRAHAVRGPERRHEGHVDREQLRSLDPHQKRTYGGRAASTYRTVETAEAVSTPGAR